MRRALKVLHIYKEYYPVLGGIENHIRLVCDSLVGSGEFRPGVLVTNQGIRTLREQMDGVPVVRSGRLATISRNPISVSMPLELWQQQADIIHLHFPFPTGEMSYLLAGRGRKMVITYHSDIVKQQALLRFYGPFMRMVLRRADRIIATSSNYAQSSPHLASHLSRVKVVPLGIDTTRFATVDAEKVAALRQRYGTPLLLFVGVLRYYKGLPFLIEAMRELDARLVIVGQGPMEPELRAQIESQGLHPRIFLTGEVSDADLPSYYHACDIFVLPSSQRSEAFGLSQVEAMACGKPVVCTELGTGTSFVNQHGETGLVVPPMDSEALARAIDRLLADPYRRAEMGRKAAARVQAEFSREPMMRRIVEVYRQVAG